MNKDFEDGSIPSEQPERKVPRKARKTAPKKEARSEDEKVADAIVNLDLETDLVKALAWAKRMRPSDRAKMLRLSGEHQAKLL